MKQKVAFLLVLSAFIMPSTLFAATDGTVGTTSTGTANISLTIPKLVRIRGMADIAFGSYTGTGDLNANEDVNISSNYTGTYRVTATGSGAAGAFTVTDGSQTIAYAVLFNDQTGTSGEVAVTSGTALTTQSGLLKPLSTATDNANYHVRMLEANIQAVDAATYSGTLTLVVAPE